MKVNRNHGYKNNLSPNSSLRLKGRYDIISYLGSGGFGDTFLAEDSDLPSKQKCVVKLLKPASDQFAMTLERSFKKEAKILEKLSKNCEHRIPELYAYFVQEGRYYLVQEYVQGVTLTNLLKIKRFSELEVKNLLVELLRTLRYLHQNQVIHRDIKPDNIIVRSKDGIPVLIDFGAVKEILTVDRDTTRSVTLVVGTPGFMPLEQLSGQPTYASDIYALGMTAICLLTGKIPQALNMGEWHKGIEVSDHLIRVLNCAIAHDLHERYKSAPDMLADLRKQAVAEVQTAPIQPVIKKHPEAFILDTDKLLTAMLTLVVIVPLLLFINSFKEVNFSKVEIIDMGVIRKDFLKK